MKDEGKIDNRLIDSDIIQKDESSDLSLRPQKLSEFIGQPQVQKNLSTFISAAGHREEAMEMLESTADQKGSTGFGFKETPARGL